jgi:anti-sigma factor RsiW
MDNFLRCDSVVSLTARLVDGAVEPHRRELVEMHLLACPACLWHVRKVRDLRAILGGLPGRGADPDGRRVPERLLALAATVGAADMERTDA